MDPFSLALLGLGAKGISALFSGHAKADQAKRTRAAQIAALNLQQKQKEDARRSRLQLGSSLLGGVPGTTAGGGVNTNVGLDPATLAKLMQERTYDFGSAIPQQGGATSEFLAGLFGGLGDTVPYAAGGPGSSSIVPPAGAAGSMSGDPTSSSPRTTTVTFEDLLKMLGLNSNQYDTPGPGGPTGG